MLFGGGEKILNQVVVWSSVYVRLRIILAIQVNYPHHQLTGKMKLKLTKHSGLLEYLTLSTPHPSPSPLALPLSLSRAHTRLGKSGFDFNGE